MALRCTSALYTYQVPTLVDPGLTGIRIRRAISTPLPRSHGDRVPWHMRTVSQRRGR